MTDDDLDACTIKAFMYDILRPGFEQTICYDVQIPLPDENAHELDFFGHLIALNSLELPFHKEVKEAFIAFVREETRKFKAERAAKDIEKLLTNGCDELLKVWSSPERNQDCSPKSSASAGDELFASFEEQFQRLMKQASGDQLSTLIREEARMTDEMRTLIRARDFEVDRIKRACETIAAADATEDNLGKHSYELSMLNEKLRQVSINYSNQVEALSERQKHDYRALVRKLCEEGDEEVNGKKAAINGHGQQHTPRSHHHHCSLANSSSSGALDAHASRVFKKSMSCDSRILQNSSFNSSSASENCRSESFTVYIGAQLKTMHNARILVCDRLVDLMRAAPSSSNQHHHIEGEDDDDDLLDSRRLHVLMSLYRRDLSAMVLLVGSDPLFHVKQRTPFAQLCEQSAELHFDSLEQQLNKLGNEIRKANMERRRRKEDPNASPLAYDPPLDDSFSYDENTLRPGDVYITCHSNLSAVQVVFHLVGDRSLSEEEISSRHPCIGGLRNIIRLLPRCAIQHITVPLLLVEQMTEKMTISWCLGRAELLYKCLKGFLMEVCSTSSASSSSATASVPASGAQSPHFNINFALPSAISGALFAQLVELFCAIFHLVPSMNAQ